MLAVVPIMASNDGPEDSSPVPEGPSDQVLSTEELKTVEKEISSLNDINAKHKRLWEHYKSLYIKNRKLEREMALVQRHQELQDQERAGLSDELSKSEVMKSKLENLCRELQKQNKILMEGQKNLEDEEQQKREELSALYEATFREMESKVLLRDDERERLRHDCEVHREKVRNLKRQLEIRDLLNQKQLRSKELECQLAGAKLCYQNEICRLEMNKNQSYREQVATILQKEHELRLQLASYAVKFEQFQETLGKSNEVFSTFKQEMERMTKTIKKLEKDKASLIKKCEATDVALIDMAEERNNHRRDIDTLKTKNSRLEALCRVLQTERKKGEKNDLKPIETAPMPAKKQSIVP